MSATFDSDMFAQYFALPVRDQLEPAPIVSVEGKPFQVREFYTEDLQALSEVYFIMIYTTLRIRAHLFKALLA